MTQVGNKVLHLFACARKRLHDRALLFLNTGDIFRLQQMEVAVQILQLNIEVSPPACEPAEARAVPQRYNQKLITRRDGSIWMSQDFPNLIHRHAGSCTREIRSSGRTGS